MKKMTHIINCAFKALFGTVSIIQATAFFSIISCSKVTFRVYKSVFPKELFEGILSKDANNIWLLGKNNLDSFGACR
jgi:hypothetical protein